MILIAVNLESGGRSVMQDRTFHEISVIVVTELTELFHGAVLQVHPREGGCGTSERYNSTTFLVISRQTDDGNKLSRLVIRCIKVHVHPVRHLILIEDPLFSLSYLLLVKDEKRSSMERLAAQTDHVRSYSHVQDPMFGEVGEFPVDVEHARTCCHDHDLLAGSVVHSVLLG